MAQAGKRHDLFPASLVIVREQMNRGVELRLK